MSPFCIALIGPTAAGKTQIALDIAHRFPCEIISVDSMLVYRGMDIGTAKPSESVRTQVPHHLIDVCDVQNPYSAALFCRHVHDIVLRILQRGRIPFFVGGTLLYLHALQQGLSALPEADPAIRSQLQQLLREEGLAALHAQLAHYDPVAAARIHAHDTQRILRALEVYHITGMPFSVCCQRGRVSAAQSRAYTIRVVVLLPEDRCVLYNRINQRFMQMLSAGWEQEVTTLLAQPGVHPDLPALRAVGYRQMVSYLLGDIPFSVCKEKGMQATRRLAKRQLTWLRHHWTHDPRVDPIATHSHAVMDQCIAHWGLRE